MHVRIDLEFEFFKRLLATCQQSDDETLQELESILWDKLDRMAKRAEYSANINNKTQ